MKLPTTGKEWASHPKPIRLDPDTEDLLIASHYVLKPCPFCGDRSPIAFCKLNENSGNFIYTISCTNFHCNGQVFCCQSTRKQAREEAIEHWQKRATETI